VNFAEINLIHHVSNPLISSLTSLLNVLNAIICVSFYYPSRFLNIYNERYFSKGAQPQMAKCFGSTALLVVLLSLLRPGGLLHLYNHDASDSPSSNIMLLLEVIYGKLLSKQIMI
jgi:hypothetical protein